MHVYLDLSRALRGWSRGLERAAWMWRGRTGQGRRKDELTLLRVSLFDKLHRLNDTKQSEQLSVSAKRLESLGETYHV